MVAILNPAGPGAQIPIDRAVVLIGRSPECDVVLDGSSRISRMHCALVQVDSEYFIRDLGSMNGVTVGGQRIEKDAKLTDGIEVLIGDVKYQFLQNVMPAARAVRGIKGKGMPAFVDETIEVLDVEEVEIVEPLAPAHGRAIASPLPSRPSAGQQTRPNANQAARLNRDVIEDVEIIDAEVIDDFGVIDVIEVIDDVEIVDAEVIDDVEIVDVVEVVEDVEVLDDIEVIDEAPRRPRPRPRLR